MTGPVALLPLDDRPCNRLFPAELAPIAGAEVLTPPPPLLGRFLAPGDTAACADWLLEAAGRAAALIVSADMLCYGGLIASREPAVPTQEALARLDVLGEIKRRHPSLPILAFGVLMRLGRTVISEETWRLHLAVVRYAELADQVERHGRADLAGELAECRAGIAETVLEDYLRVRARNHVVNRRLVELVATGVVDHGVIAQEDCAGYGLHRGEQADLRGLMAQLGVENRVPIYPGADEVGCVLLARLLAPGLRVQPLFASIEEAQQIARYEDRPLAETVRGQIRGAGAAVAEDEADLVLAVSTPRHDQQEASEAGDEATDIDPGFLDNIARLLDGGTAVSMADVAYANGGDPALVAALGERGLTSRLAGYAGWNTTGNTVGTAVAQGLLHVAGGAANRPERALASAQFTFERLVDDYAYQMLRRPEAYRRAVDLHRSPFDLGRRVGKLERAVRELLTPEAERLYREHFAGREVAGRRLAAEVAGMEISLPWPRLFEVEVRARLAASSHL